MSYVGKMNMDEILDKWEKEDTQAGRFKPKSPCEALLRILPSIDPEDPYKFCARFGMHWNIKTVAKNAPLDKKAVACLYQTLGQDCPMCRAVEALYDRASATGDESISKLASSVRAKLRFAFNVIDTDNPKNGVLIWEIPNDAMKMFKACLKRNKKALDPREGQALVVTYEKKEKFLTVTSIQPSNEVSEVPQKDWFEKLKDLEAYVQGFIVPADEMRRWIVDDISTLSGAVAENTARLPRQVATPQDQEDDLFNDTDDALDEESEAGKALKTLRSRRAS